MKKKRLAIFLPSLAGGGGERAMVRLAGGLAERGYDLDMVLVRAEGPYLSSISKKVRLVDLKSSRALFSLPSLVAYLRRERPEALLSTWDFANVLALWARCLAGVPRRVVVLDQNTISIASRLARQWRQRLVPRLIKIFYPWADYIVGNSRGVVADLALVTGLPDNKIQMIYNPIVTPDLQEKAMAPLHHPWFEPGQPPVVLAVGRLTPQKDFPTLIEAFALARKSMAARLLILGEGPDRPMLQAMVERLGIKEDVNLASFVENPYAYMARSSLFVLSSRWEGLPTVLVEALSCNVPVIATDCPSGPREILANGHYGKLVPVQDVGALAEAIRAALNGEISSPSPESWQPYKLDTIVDQYLKLLIGA